MIMITITIMIMIIMTQIPLNAILGQEVAVIVSKATIYITDLARYVQLWQSQEKCSFGRYLFTNTKK